MRFDGNRLTPLEWIFALGWTGYCFTLGLLALVSRSISLGSRGGIGHYEGMSAIVAGLMLLGAGLVGVAWLLRLHPLRRQLRALLFVAWFAGSAGYLYFFSA